MTGTKVIGAALLRKEDYRFVTGQGRYLDDIVFPGCLHAHFVRSPHAHARIAAIDCAAARSAEGVIAVVTGRELAEWTAPARMAPPIEGLHPVGFGFSSSHVSMVTTMPGVQNPHCRPCSSCKACLTGESPSAPKASMVVISLPCA